MKRLAGITTIYALIAALALVAPLSASDEVTPDTPAPAGTAAPSETTPEAAPPEAAPPEAAPPEAAPAPPETAPPAPETAPPAETPAEEVAPPAEAVAAPGAEPSPDRKRSRDRAAPRATAAADTSVTVRDFDFAPSSITVDVGDTVTWTNEGPTPHTATADDGSFDTGVFEAGESRSHTFDQAGTFQYFCQPHPQMRGTVTVRAASTAGGDGGGGGGDTSGEDSGTATDDGTASGDGSGATLPATGVDAGGLAVLGLMTVALGAWLRRRASAAG
jgi:LPXTG-motif cell wall-anchored protein